VLCTDGKHSARIFLKHILEDVEFPINVGAILSRALAGTTSWTFKDTVLDKIAALVQFKLVNLSHVRAMEANLYEEVFG